MNDFSVEIEIQIEPAVSPSAGYVAIDTDRLERLVTFALDAEAVVGAWAIVVVVTSDDHLRQLHNQFMGIDEETDVMTFPYEATPQDETNGGDIVISLDRATENAQAFGKSVEAEVEFLAVHGTLHLCGWDDHDPSDRERMLTRQDAIIAAFEASQHQ